jgi:citrate lyase alpha subunit|tara:strand:- start:469 stop:666 length:198 start_codon:yes stop_codon:yes gene_type:complete
MATYENIEGSGNTIQEAKQDLVDKLTEAGVKPMSISKIMKNSWQRVDNPDGTFTAFPTGANFIRI